MSGSGEGEGVWRGWERGHQQELGILNRRVTERQSTGEYHFGPDKILLDSSDHLEIFFTYFAPS